jgi:hypothetical protein
LLKKIMLVPTLLLATLMATFPATAQHHDDRNPNGNFHNGLRQGGRGGHYDDHRRYDDDRNRGGIGPGKGALIGGAGGAALGAIFGGGLKGTLIGGAAGAGIGAIVGNNAQNNRDRRRY